MFWGNFGRGFAVAPGHDEPPQDPMDRKEKSRTDRRRVWGGGGAEYESERGGGVRWVYIPEQVRLRRGPAPETLLDSFNSLARTTPSTVCV